MSLGSDTRNLPSKRRPLIVAIGIVNTVLLGLMDRPIQNRGQRVCILNIALEAEPSHATEVPKSLGSLQRVAAQNSQE